MLITIADYCKKRNVSRQFVYEYIKLGKFKAHELAVYAEYEGTRIHVGIKKFIEVPEALAPNPFDRETELGRNDTEFVSQITDNPELQAFYKIYLTLTDKTKRASFKKEMYARIDQRPDTERFTLRAAIDEANVKLMQYMKLLHKDMVAFKEKSEKNIVAINQSI
jgi:hypothetical protein